MTSLRTKNVEIEFCPTDRMIAHYMTMPLINAIIKVFRKAIMNI
jgi:hypothetical protein